MLHKASVYIKQYNLLLLHYLRDHPHTNGLFWRWRVVRGCVPQRFQRVETLLLVSREQRTNLSIQLFEDRTGGDPRLLVDRIELRLDRVR